MARKPDIKLLHKWLEDYSREDLINLITKDFTHHKLSENTAIMFGYRRKLKPSKTIGVNEPNKELIKKPAMDEIEYIKRPYTIEEASKLYNDDNFVSGIVRIDVDELIDSLGEELQLLLVSQLIDGNSQQLKKDTDIEIEGSDTNGLYFKVTCHADPCINGQSIN